VDRARVDYWLRYVRRTFPLSDPPTVEEAQAVVRARGIRIEYAEDDEALDAYGIYVRFPEPTIITYRGAPARVYLHELYHDFLAESGEAEVGHVYTTSPESPEECEAQAFECDLCGDPWEELANELRQQGSYCGIPDLRDPAEREREWQLGRELAALRKEREASLQREAALRAELRRLEQRALLRELEPKLRPWRTLKKLSPFPITIRKRCGPGVSARAGMSTFVRRGPRPRLTLE
jgi:hypothetical protein